MVPAKSRRRGGDRYRRQSTTGNSWGGITRSTFINGLFPTVRSGTSSKGGNSNLKKEAELSLAPDILDEIPLENKVITGDALFTQRNLCQKIIDRKGDYLFIVKANQEHLHWAIQFLFDKPAQEIQIDQTEQWSRHGDRREVRRLWASTALNDYLAWPGLQQVLKVARETETKDQKESQVRYAITSLGIKTNPQKLLRLVRGHWAIENKLFWVRDVTLGEDASQIRKGVAPEVMAALRNVVISLFRRSGVTNIAAALRENGWQHHGSTLLNLLLTVMQRK